LAGLQLDHGSAEQYADAEFEPVRRSSAFLAEASAQLAVSLEYGATLRRITDLAVPALADWCVVDALDEHGAVQLLAAAHVDPDQDALICELRRRYPPDPQAQYGLPKVLRTGRAELYPEVRPAWREAAARDADHLRLMRALNAQSSMCVPLVARGRVLGAITLVSARAERQYGPADLALAEDLASRCALALDNARLYGELQEALHGREVFLAALAHDLKNPLSITRGYAQMLGRLAGKLARPESAGQLAGWGAAIEANANRMDALVDELLDLARLEAGRPLELKCVPTELVELTRRVVQEHRRLSERHQLDLETSVPVLTGWWDGPRLERVVDNLLGNAIKYSPSGGRVGVRISRRGRWAVMTVADAGIGIPAADLPRIFDRFHRGSNVKGHMAGSGIGLAGVRQIVLQHGGRIGVKSREGEGTTVTVRLPLN
jgi:signal transduction histidine kinase